MGDTPARHDDKSFISFDFYRTWDTGGESGNLTHKHQKTNNALFITPFEDSKVWFSGVV